MKKFTFVSFSILAFVFVYLLSGCKVRPAVTTISLDSAKQQVSIYNSRVTQSRDSLRSVARSNSFLYKAEFFTKNDLQALLGQKGCTGIRVYHALDTKGRAVVYIVGVSGTSDQLPKNVARGQQPVSRRNLQDSSAANSSNTGAVILKSEVPCPHVCPDNGL